MGSTSNPGIRKREILDVSQKSYYIEKLRDELQYLI